MQTQAQIVWKGLEASDALAERIHSEVAHLGRTYRRITACRVVVEAGHRHHDPHGHHFQVKVELVVPGKVLTVSHDPAPERSSEDAYATVSEAFATLRRQLEEYVHIKRNVVKRHANRSITPRGR